MITQEYIKEILEYNRETGQFSWLIPVKKKSKDGYAGKVERVSGYRRIGINGKYYAAHRLAWLYIYGDWPDGVIDHLNQDKLDNRIENLRSVTVAQNGRNCKMAKNNTSGITGVDWHRSSGKWRVRACQDSRRTNLGFYDNIFDAAAAAISARNSMDFHENHGRK